MPGTLQRLLPGQSAIVRAQAQWVTGNAEGRPRVLAQPNGDVRVKVSLFLPGQLVPGSPEPVAVVTESSNALSATVVPAISPLR